MKLRKLSILVMAGLIGAAMTTPAVVHSQDNSYKQQEMNESGSSASSAVHEAGQSVKHLYHATKEEVSDAALTTKVKTALLKDSMTRKSAIHVKSNDGAVTLSGAVDSPQVADHAERLTADVSGVRSVNNQLTWHTSAR